LITFPKAVNAQQFTPAPVEKSKQRILHEGKVYFIHNVKTNQTLYSISRAYGVTVQDIAAANPNVLLELIAEGQVLRIPAQSSLDQLTESYFGLSETDFIYHTVQPQQTIHFLANKYNVSKEEIYYFNPGTEDVIQIGQVIKIPKKQSRIVSQAPEIDTSNTYRVKEGDTLYSLSKKFGLSIAEIIKTNPQLRWGLKSGMTIRLDGDVYSDSIDYAGDSLDLKLHKRLELHSWAHCDSTEYSKKNESLKMVLMLPFHAEDLLALDTITNDSIRVNHTNFKFRSRGVSFTEYYEGFLVAVDSMLKHGAQISLFAYDTKSDTNEIDKILLELDIVRPDIIVGPVIPANIRRVSAYSKEKEIPLILPTASTGPETTLGNPFAVSLMPEMRTEINNCADYLSQFHDKNIILIHNEDSPGTDKIDKFRENLFAYFSSKAAYEQALYKEIRVTDTMRQGLELTLRDNMDNIVIVVSSNEAYVSNIIGLLKINQSKGYSIELFGLPVWQSFNNLRIELLHQLNTVVYSPFYIDYSKPETHRFIEQAKTLIGHEPYKTVNSGAGFNYTYLGYETGLIFTEAYAKHGAEFLKCLCNIRFEMPQSNYKFEYSHQGGFANSTLNFVNYTTEFDIKSIDFESLKELNNKKYEPELDVSTFIEQ
jgi:LysM repeat protein/ABC-type branched-subunit amino acid transport system substrate-binding protein